MFASLPTISPWGESTLRLRDQAFQKVFSSTFVYNILFEDTEVDERYLGIDEDSTVLSISGAGCGVAGMLSKHPRRVDATDINRHHLALTALKCAAARMMDSYEDFYDLLGRGWSNEPKQVIGPLLDHMPDWAASYWRRHYRRFAKSLYRHGITARMFRAARNQLGISTEWARSACSTPVEQRMANLQQRVAQIDTPLTRAMLESPLQLVALGVNFEQRDKIVTSQDMPSMMDFFIEHLMRVMQTELWTNWFFWYAATGAFNHVPEGVPPYLRRDRWEQSREAPTDLRFHHRNLFELLGEAGPNTWSHYTLCDAIDWMPANVQHRLFKEIRRTARPDATIMLRSCGYEDPVEAVGADRFLIKLPISEQASVEERSCAYRQTNFYRMSA